jgi:hypothetical protein
MGGAPVEDKDGGEIRRTRGRDDGSDKEMVLLVI